MAITDKPCFLSLEPFSDTQLRVRARPSNITNGKPLRVISQCLYGPKEAAGDKVVDLR